MTFLQPKGSNEKPIYARSGWLIPQDSDPGGTSPNLIMGDIHAIMRSLIAKYPGVRIRSTSPYPYNCVGMVFASRRAWINADHLDRILKEDYFRLIDRSNVMIGDVVVYDFLGSPAHVGIIYEIMNLDFLVISKWGDGYEMIHPMRTVPDGLGEPARFYTDREVR